MSITVYDLVNKMLDHLEPTDVIHSISLGQFGTLTDDQPTTGTCQELNLGTGKTFESGSLNTDSDRPFILFRKAL